VIQIHHSGACHASSSAENRRCLPGRIGALEKCTIDDGVYKYKMVCGRRSKRFDVKPLGLRANVSAATIDDVRKDREP
jgi:hypothetical protein